MQHCNVITYNVKNVDENWSNGASVFVWVSKWAKWGHIICAYSSVWQNENLEMQLCKMYTTRNFMEVWLQKVFVKLSAYVHTAMCLYTFSVSVSMFLQMLLVHMTVGQNVIALNSKHMDLTSCVWFILYGIINYYHSVYVCKNMYTFVDLCVKVGVQHACTSVCVYVCVCLCVCVCKALRTARSHSEALPCQVSGTAQHGRL